MKKTTILLFALLISVSSFSQKRTRSLFGWHLEKDTPVKLNEIKVNLGSSILAYYPEISYERILSEDLSIGSTLGFNLSSDEFSSTYPTNFTFTPYVRWFFGGNANNLQKYGAGFFIEGNGALLSTYENDFGAGLGLATGWKYLSKNNWVGELMVGAGRDFINDGGYVRVDRKSVV